jgi:hypothetical protein
MKLLRLYICVDLCLIVSSGRKNKIIFLRGRYMKMTKIDAKNRIVNITLSRDELLVIFKAFANIEFGIKQEQYREFLNVDKLYIDTLRNDIENILNAIYLEINELELIAIYGTILHIPIWCSKNDCSSMLGISCEYFLDIKAHIVAAIREVDRLFRIDKSTGNPGNKHLPLSSREGKGVAQ